jgi:serine/threonine-protein kinase
MVTGTVPFRKSNYNALMQSIINDSPTSIPDHAAGDRALWLVVERGLKKDRNERWADMTEFGEALALWLYEHGIKEDVSGNSIRAVWLDGVLSGLRADIPASEVPPTGAGTGPSRVQGRVNVGSAANTTEPEAVGGARGLLARVLGMNPRRRLALGALAAVAAAATVSWAVGVLSSAPEPRDETPRRPAVALKPEPPPPVKTPRATAQAAPDPPPAPSAPPDKTDPDDRESAQAAAAPQHRTAPVRRRPTTTSRSRRAIHDFGF